MNNDMPFMNDDPSSGIFKYIIMRGARRLY